VNVAIIPARGGSKRIPRKNVKPFLGKPMIAWSIETARRAGCFDRIVVSTDDEEIAEVATRNGAEAPFRRPAALASDHAATVPVVAHAIEWLRQQGQAPDPVCCIYPTAPLMAADDLRRGLVLLRETGADYVVACTTYAYPIQRALRRDEAGRVAMLWPEHAATRSQDLPQVLHDAGQFYWGRAQAFVEGRTILGPAAAPLMVDRHRVQDIDTPEDWNLAEMLYRVAPGIGT